MARKTVDVSYVLEKANNMLRLGTTSPDARHGVITLLTEILHTTGNYNGFRHLTINEIPVGHNPGIRMGENSEMLPYEERFKDTDETRVQYY